jgi:hypothetical protein
MQNLYEVVVKLKDNGVEFERKEEVTSKNDSSLPVDLKKQLDKYRSAMGLSKNFSFEIVTACHIGWA